MLKLHADNVGQHMGGIYQRHFLRATGITYANFRQIERARYATTLLQQGASTMDAVHQAGYFDQAHFTNHFRRVTGSSPVAWFGQARAR